ncbi:hypothetical protein EAO72_27220 [Streptomyces sp. or43]|nr:hypothetical protein EAO72_27220 [Streptomyces sp. or43]
MRTRVESASFAGVSSRPLSWRSVVRGMTVAPRVSGRGGRRPPDRRAVPTTLRPAPCVGNVV